MCDLTDRKCCWLLLLSLTIVLTNVQPCMGYNILGLFPHPVASHAKVFNSLMRQLVHRNHNVTVVSYFKSTGPPMENYTEWILPLSERSKNFTFSFEHFASHSFFNLFTEYLKLHNEGQESCKIFFESNFCKLILREIAKYQFDVVIMEFFNTDCYMIIPYMLKVPVVGVSSSALMPWYYDRVDLPLTTHIQTDFLGFVDDMTWFQRQRNFVDTNALKLFYRSYTNLKDSLLIKKYFNQTIDVNEFAIHVTLLILVNQHFTLTGPHITTPQLVEIGGVDESLLNVTLPEEISTFLDTATARDGVLFIDWDDDIMDKSRLKVISTVLQRQRLNVIWNWKSDEKPPVENNKKFLFVKSAPQLALLCNTKVNKYWSRGDLLGTINAAYCGTAMLVTPKFGQQYANAEAVKRKGTGLILYYDYLDETSLTNALKELRQFVYSKNAAALSAIFRDRQNSALNSSVYWIENVLRHGYFYKHLMRTKQGKRQTWYTHYSVDLWGTLIGLGLIFSIAPLRMLYFRIKGRWAQNNNAHNNAEENVEQIELY